jgi:hypothetical protein
VSQRVHLLVLVSLCCACPRGRDSDHTSEPPDDTTLVDTAGSDSHSDSEPPFDTSDSEPIADTSDSVPIVDTSDSTVDPDDPDGDGWNRDDDCDSGDPSIHPGALETCDDGVDQDCSGMDLDCDASLADASAKLTGHYMSSAGVAVAAAGDMDGDGLDDLFIGASSTHAIDEGSVFVTRGPPTGTSSLADSAHRIRGSEAGDGFGCYLAGLGDTDGDGFPDLLSAAPYNYDGGTQAGAAYLILGSASLPDDVGSADATFYSATDWARVGSGTAAAGDTDGDGMHELLIGATGLEYGGYEGVVFLVDADARGTVSLADSRAQLVADSPTNRFLAGAADVTGDGLDDVLVSAGTGSDGLVALFSSPASGMTHADDAHASVRLGTTGADSWLTIATGSDVDGDGYTDLLLGEAHDEHGDDSYGPGSAFLFLGPVTGAVDSHGAVARLTGPIRSERPSTADTVALPGDLDGDGWEDLAVGEPAYRGYSTGVYVVYGPVTGTLPLSEHATRFAGEEARDNAGRSVAAAGDTDGDGLPDLVVGANYDAAGAQMAGAAYLLRWAP